MKRVIAVLLILLAGFMIGCEEETVVPPTITIISPQDYASVSGEVEIVLDANSDADISKVEIYIDGELATVLTEVSESGLWNWTWDTREIPITEFYSYDYTGYSLHTLYVKAEDGDGDDAGTEVISLMVERRRYGYTFGDAVTGRDSQIILGEDDDLGHLWLYFPRIQRYNHG